MNVDFGKTAEDYATHRPGFPPELFARLADHGVGLARQDVVDLGAGTGALSRALAARGCRVVGVDLSASMIEQGRRLAARDGRAVSFVQAPAEDTGLPAGSADVVTAMQCWHWFDRPRATAECLRLLRPGGALAILHFDWVILKGRVADATETLISQHNPAWTLGGGSGLYPDWLADLGDGGFQSIETFSFDVVVPYTPETWRGRIRASAGIGASLPQERVAAFDRDLAEMLRARFPGDTLDVPHRAFAIIARAP